MVLGWGQMWATRQIPTHARAHEWGTRRRLVGGTAEAVAARAVPIKQYGGPGGRPVRMEPVHPHPCASA